jgi:FkbM family methyltransferase
VPAARPPVGKAVARWREPGWTVENLRKPGFAPRTLLDVGAGAGTAGLYEAFPEAHLVLIEPQEEHRQALERLLEGRPGEVLATAAGAMEGTARLNVDPGAPFVSSILERADGSPRPLEPRDVPLTTLDRLLEERRWTPPFGLKIDTEGFEDQVIDGASRLLEQTQFVIAEVSVLERFHESYSFAGFVALMAQRGFELCDILDGSRLATRELLYVDAVFRRRA